MDNDKSLRHLAIIMDGNGRWAKSKHLARSRGHQKGVQTVRKVVKHCAKLGVNTLTLFAFSSENMKRSSEEVGLLFATPDNGRQDGPTAVTQLPNGSYVYRIRANEQNQKSVLKDAIEKVLPPRVSPTGELMPSVWTQAYQDLANQE